jgi:hypothetical protein
LDLSKPIRIWSLTEVMLLRTNDTMLFGRLLAQFDFRPNSGEHTEIERRMLAAGGFERKRLKYRESSSNIVL